MELTLQSIPFYPQQNITLFYKGQEMKKRLIPDLIIFDKIIVELKAVDQLTDKHRAQVLNYLNASGSKLALLVNFGHHPCLEWERIVLDH